MSPADIEFSPRRLLQPDLFVVPAASPRRTRHDVKSLLLVVEVLSPSTAHANRHAKRTIYMDEGIPEYWIVDLDGRVVERWEPGEQRPEVLTSVLSWQPLATVEPLRIQLTTYFSDVLD
jgi:Uma2 family endonuclease